MDISDSNSNSFAAGGITSALLIHGFDPSLPRMFWQGIPAAQMRGTL